MIYGELRGVGAILGTGVLEKLQASIAAAGMAPPLGAIPDSELTPRVRALLLQQIDENQLLSAALEQMRERIEELERLVDTDTLTPLPNRRRFLREIERVVQHGRRYGTEATVMFVDVDGLKAINDGHGHLAGDATLIHIAGLLQSMVRASDIVARIGGDEFGLLLEHIGIEAAQEKARALIDTVANTPMLIGGKRVRLGISIGIAELTPEDDAESLLFRADVAMYEGRAQLRSER